MTSMVQADLGPSSSVVKYKDDPIEDPVSLFLFFLSFLVPSQHPSIPVSYPSRRGYGQGVYYYVTFVSLTRARFLYASNMYGPEAGLISIIPSCRRDSAFTVHGTLLSSFYHNGKKTLTNDSFDPDILNSTTLVQPFSSIKPTVQAPLINRLLLSLLLPTPRIRCPTVFPIRLTDRLPRNPRTTRRIPLTPRLAPPASILLVVSGLSFSLLVTVISPSTSV